MANSRIDNAVLAKLGDSGGNLTYDGQPVGSGGGGLAYYAELVIAASDEVTDLTTGTAKATLRMPFLMELTEVRASVNTEPTGSDIQVDINKDGTTILSTPITIDDGEKTSLDAGTPPVISTTTLENDSEITIDIDSVGSSTAGKGLKVILKGMRPTNADITLSVSDETTDLTTGTAKVTFRMPYAMTLTSVKASVTTAPSGAGIIVDINQAGSTTLSTKIHIDDGYETSVGSATPAVISGSSLIDDAEITIDIDQVGSGTPGKGLKVTLKGTRV